MFPRKLKIRKERVKLLLPRFKKLFPKPQSELKYKSDWEFVVSVILSAQCTDKRVNIVTKRLFKKYKKLSDYTNASKKEFEKDIFSTGFYKNKTKNIISCAKILEKKHKGNLPRSLKEIIKLPGIGRKSGNVILSNLYGINEGIAVDTHVIRFARKFDLTDHIDPIGIEKDLMRVFPKKEWGRANHYMVLYGRYMCPAHREECRDELTAIYPPAVYKIKK